MTDIVVFGDVYLNKKNEWKVLLVLLYFQKLLLKKYFALKVKTQQIEHLSLDIFSWKWYIETLKYPFREGTI